MKENQGILSHSLLVVDSVDEVDGVGDKNEIDWDDASDIFDRGKHIHQNQESERT